MCTAAGVRRTGIEKRPAHRKPEAGRWSLQAHLQLGSASGRTEPGADAGKLHYLRGMPKCRAGEKVRYKFRFSPRESVFCKSRGALMIAIIVQDPAFVKRWIAQDQNLTRPTSTWTKFRLG